ncbi:disintegrin and metalloproteinase domain-containing protein 5-like isoform X3 [Mesoplodon densirostris]|uniref:disintegrin and metalloproteinase domain-containing protein 5-like isoform X3 n=1 Tax=Mesoplodon densirostris TaxID=48708 RepID=UPI0028DB5BB4|nr:disintegrin and metalloproteinase domain-containing protein 5-like isoform X3 [Mesoplodon densirostris]
MFLMLVLLTGLGGLHGGRDPHKTFVQTTVPEKISISEAVKHPEANVAYIITIEGKPYFIHLKKQSSLSSASVVYSYDRDDTQHSQPLSAQMDCNYHGYVAGFPNSLVSLNICSGLRGILQFKNISYGIEPMEAVSGFVHMIHEEKNDITNIPLLWENDTYIYDSSQYQVRKSSERPGYFKLFPRYLDMYIVVDKNLFDYMGSDVKVVTQKVIQIIGFVNSMLTQLKLTVRISSIEIWSNKNKISTTRHPNHILYRLLEWKYEFLSQPHHTAYLFAFQKTPTFIGVTYPAKICDKNFAGGVALYSEGLSLESYAVSIVQLLGLNMGMSYDNTEMCHCSGDVCTMSPKAVLSRGIKDFSTCSLDDFKYFAAHSGLECLRKILPDEPVHKQRKMCGNGKLELGEECDCGTLQNCTHPDCCDPRTCTKKTNKICGSGECCTRDCKIKPVNTPCRQPIDECDFLEFCDGNNAHCVPDTYARDGQSCDSGDSFCYRGRCRSFTRQCRKLIGGASRGAPFACFDEINSRGDKFGNCGRNYCNYPDDVCTSTYLNTEKTPRDTLTTVEKPEDRDQTFVEDGTMCGPEMYCLRFNCVELKYHVNFQSCNSTRDCNSSGVCNNFNNCHCKMGFAPPHCKPMAGDFGSVDDGHRGKVGKKLLREISLSHPKHRLQLIFYISLPVFIITIAVIIISQSKIRELCYRGEPESERSVSEESSSNSKLSLSVSNSL